MTYQVDPESPRFGCHFFNSNHLPSLTFGCVNTFSTSFWMNLARPIHLLCLRNAHRYYLWSLFPGSQRF